MGLDLTMSPLQVSIHIGNFNFSVLFCFKSLKSMVFAPVGVLLRTSGY